MSYVDRLEAELEAEKEVTKSLLRELRRRPKVASLLKLEDGRVVKVEGYEEVNVEQEIQDAEAKVKELRNFLPQPEEAPAVPEEEASVEPTPAVEEPAPEVLLQPELAETAPEPVVEPAPAAQVMDVTPPAPTEPTPEIHLG